MAKPVKQPKGATFPHCPFCDAELFAMNLPICQSCHATIVFCSECKEALPKGAKSCPKCGAKIGKK